MSHVFVIDEEDLKGTPRLCSYSPKAKKLNCSAIPAPAAKKSPRLRLWGTTDVGAEPLVFAGDRGREGIYRAKTGKKLVQSIAYGSTARRDGALQLTIWNEKKRHVSLMELSADGRSNAKKLIDYERSGNPYYHTALFWDWLIYKARNQDNEIHMYAREVGRGFSNWGKVQDIGPVVEPSVIMMAGNPPHFEACRLGDTTVVRARGYRNDRLSFLNGGVWSKPILRRGVGGSLTCMDKVAVKAHAFEGDIVHNRCTKDSCETAFFSLSKAGRTASPPPNTQTNRLSPLRWATKWPSSTRQESVADYAWSSDRQNSPKWLTSG